MAENKKPRTNWSDKARRITGVIAVAVVILVIVLSVSLGKGKSAPSQTVKVEPAPTVVTESKPVVQESTEEVKTEEVEVKPEKVEIEAEPIIEIVEAEEVEAAAPEIEEAVEEAKVEETVETVHVVEDIVEEPPVVEEVAPVEAETASFTLFGYTVENSWLDGVFTSTLKEKGIVAEDDVRGFALSEVEKYGEMLTANTAISFVPDGFTLTYPETVNPADYIDVYKADLVAYITALFASEEAPEVEEAPVEEKKAETASFTLFGYTVENSWLDGVFTSTLKEKGIVTEDEVRGFALSEVEKYGEMLTANTAISFIADGFTLTYPETVDPADYIEVYKADLDAYITSLFTSKEAPVEETEIVVEETEVPPAPEKAEAIDVPEPISDVEVKLSPKAEKVSSFSFRLGIDGGVEMGINEVDPYSTIFPRLNISLDFRNILSFGKLGFGTRFDIGSVFKPLDGTFIGHDFNYFLNGNNWAMDATVDAKLMAYLNLGKFDFYLGGGIGYSIGSHNLYNRTHSGENTVFGFDTALVATGVVGLEWNITDSFSLALEGYYRNFFQSEAKAQSFAASLVMGFRF